MATVPRLGFEADLAHLQNFVRPSLLSKLSRSWTWAVSSMLHPLVFTAPSILLSPPSPTPPLQQTSTTCAILILNSNQTEKNTMSAFSYMNILQAPPIHALHSKGGGSSSPERPSSVIRKTDSSFLGSTHKICRSISRKSLKPTSSSSSSRVFVAVSDTVKEKKVRSMDAVSDLLITREEGLEIYEDMILGRSFEDMCAQMYYRGKMFGFVHLYNGQEAVSTGFINLLKKEDSVCSTYRDHVHALSKGVSARAVMSELFGKATGCCRGQGGSMHMFSKEHNVLGGFAFIGEGIPVATGAAFTSKYRREVLKEDCDHVTLAFFGDGTCNNGQFFECLNMAALWKLPIVFVVENNLWAIGMSHLRATSDPEIWKKGPAFGMPGIHVDGMDVLKVREVAKEAIARARRGDGPTLVECETYRFRGHSLADPDELRDPAEKAHYATRDPIMALKKYIIENNLANESELKAIEKKIDEIIEDAVDFADKSPHPPRSQLLENVFADPKGFGIGPDGRYRCEDPGFTAGTAQV